MITYTEEKKFTTSQVQALFYSVGWESGDYPRRLHKALMHSPTVVTAWDGERLVGLARALDDGELVAFIHYVLVHPDYQRQGIASGMLARIRDKYRDYLYINVMPDESKNAALYEKNGFTRLSDGVALEIYNLGEKY